MKPIEEALLKELSKSGHIRVTLVAAGSYFHLVADGVDGYQRLLMSRAKRPRAWTNLSKAAVFVKESLGLSRFETDLKNYDPEARGLREKRKAA